MGFHIAKIEKGVYGEWSKVEEEIEEIIDALSQNIKPMLLIELCDCLGAVKAYYNLTTPESQYSELLFKLSVTTNKYSQYGSLDVVTERFIQDLRINKNMASSINVTKSILDFVQIYFNESITFIDLMRFATKIGQVKEEEARYETGNQNAN